MKNFKTKFLGLALAGLILGACSQTGTYENADLMNEQAVANNAGFKLTPFGSGNENARTYAATDCESFCIDPDAPEYSYQTATISNNSGSQTRVFTYTVHNTLSGFNLNWSYAATNSAARILRITVSGAGFASPKVYTSGAVQSAGNGSNTFNFDSSWAACGAVTVVAEILEGTVVVAGPSTTTYKLIGECVVDCKENFSYNENEDGTITFTYIPSEDMDDAKVVLTFAQSAVVTIDGFSPAGATMQATLDLEACETYTWTATISSLRCTGSGQTTLNAWTDMTVNEISKKNDDTPNIVRPCDND